MVSLESAARRALCRKLLPIDQESGLVTNQEIVIILTDVCSDLIGEGSLATEIKESTLMGASRMVIENFSPSVFQRLLITLESQHNMKSPAPCPYVSRKNLDGSAL